MSNKKTVSKEDLATYKAIRTSSVIAAKDEELARLRIFLKYGLSPESEFNIETGTIQIVTQRQVAPPPQPSGLCPYENGLPTRTEFPFCVPYVAAEQHAPTGPVVPPTEPVNAEATTEGNTITDLMRDEVMDNEHHAEVARHNYTVVRATKPHVAFEGNLCPECGKSLVTVSFEKDGVEACDSCHKLFDNTMNF